MTVSYCYFIGAMTVFGEAADRSEDIRIALPPKYSKAAWAVIVILAIGWPLFATLLVISRLISAVWHG